jgi:phosphoenolpyruvate carboxylase
VLYVDGAHEPYRAAAIAAAARRVAAHVSAARATRLANRPAGTYASRPGFTWEPEMFEPVSELMEPLLLCHRSLYATGNGIIADGRLTDVLRRMAAFGLTLVRLDVRQDAERHTEAVDAITRALGLGEYRLWTEERRVDFLVNVLTHGRKLTPARMPTTPWDPRHVSHDGSGHRVARSVSICGRPAVGCAGGQLLQREAGIAPPQRRPALRYARDLRAAAGGSTGSRSRGARSS